MAMTTTLLEYNCSFDYKQLKLRTEEWLYGPLFYSQDRSCTWRLQIKRSDPTKIGVYLVLINGAPCTLHSYTLSMTTNTKPALTMFDNVCTLERAFPSNNFAWGFENFCTRREFKGEKYDIRDPRSKLVNVRCIMNIEVLPPKNIVDDHRAATVLFYMRPLQEWIDLLKQRDDLPELTNRVNREIEATM